MKRNFEILNGLPPYGNIYISIPEKGYTEFSEGLAVKFIRKDKTEWIANFERGNTSLKFASELKNDEDILIIAFGICYIISAEEIKPKTEFGIDYKKIFEYKDSYVLIGEYSISIVENIHKIKHFDNLCYDGITNAKIEDKILKATLNNFKSSGDGYSKSDFILNLETFEFTENEIIEEENLITKQNEIKTIKKKWWNFW